MTGKEKIARLNDLATEYDEDIVLIGGEGEERENLATAIIGITPDGRVAYDLEKLVEAFMRTGMDYEEAQEWVDYNVMRSLPYYGDRAPIIISDISIWSDDKSVGSPDSDDGDLWIPQGK